MYFVYICYVFSSGPARSNANDRWVRRQAYSQGWILWSMDWRGFSRFDLPEIARMLLYDLNAVNTIESAVVQVMCFCG